MTIEQGTPAIDELVGASVKRWRVLSGLTQEAVTEAMVNRGFDFHQSTLYKIESGKRRVLVGEAVALAEVLGVPLEALVSPDQTSEPALLTQLKLGARLHFQAIEKAQEALSEARQARLSAIVASKHLTDPEKLHDFDGTKATVAEFYASLLAKESELDEARKILESYSKTTQKLAKYSQV